MLASRLSPRPRRARRVSRRARLPKGAPVTARGGMAMSASARVVVPPRARSPRQRRGHEREAHAERPGLPARVRTPPTRSTSRSRRAFEERSRATTTTNATTRSECRSSTPASPGRAQLFEEVPSGFQPGHRRVVRRRPESRRDRLDVRRHHREPSRPRHARAAPSGREGRRAGLVRRHRVYHELHPAAGGVRARRRDRRRGAGRGRRHGRHLKRAGDAARHGEVGKQRRIGERSGNPGLSAAIVQVPAPAPPAFSAGAF